jgi:TonB-linked SusC/RagA family outer membrane protein
MKKTLLLWLFGLLLTAQVYAQNRTLSGTVKDAATGEALIGVNVTGKGTTIGTVTDIDGKYTLELPKDVTALVFTYVGYTNLEKAVTALKIDAAMSLEGQLLEETVITAMAIQREKRSTSFTTNTVSGDDFNKTATDVFGALQGKAPGVRINTTSGQMGASTRIVLRGESSFGGNNALIIVDGIQINNNVVNGFENNSSNSIDFGNRGADIDPNNIESVTILKGPAAVALYGVRGKFGVVMITTKSGKSTAKEDKKFNVTVNTGIQFDKVYLQLKRQNKYGQGYDNAPDPIENFSWGPEFDGVIRPWTPPVQTPNGTSQLIRPYSAIENQLEEAFNIGQTFRTGIAVEGGSDKFTYYLSYNNTNNTGLFDNSFYKRHSVVANATAKLSDKITSKFNVQYSNVRQRAITGAGSGNFNGPFQALIQQPVNIPLKELRDFNSIYQDFNGYYGGYTPNPFYIMNNENNDAKVDNIIGAFELEVKPVEYISLLGRVGTNFTLTSLNLSSPKFTYPGSSASGIGRYVEENDKRNQLTLDFIASFNKEIVKNLDLTVTAGYNFQDSRANILQSATQNGLIVPGFYDLSNSVSTPFVDNAATHVRIFGVYGNLLIGYKNMIFAEYSARNDWSSTLPAGNRGFFYQSGGLSFVPTELIKNTSKAKDWISYMKIRGNVGTVGGDPGAYRLFSTFLASPRYDDYLEGNFPIQFPVIGLDGSTVSAYTLDNTIGNPELRPEKTFSWEVGADLTLLKDYVTLEYTYYDKRDRDLIVDVALPASSGYRFTTKNVGEISNKGHELVARVTALKNVKGINWDFNFNFTKNNNRVEKVSDESDELALNTGGVQVVLKEGLPFGTFKALDFSRDPNGNIVVNAQGAPVSAVDYSYFGSYQPKYQMGFGSNFSWKGLSFGIQFDVRQGGQFYSGTKSASDFNGTSLTSMLNDRQPYVVPGSVIDNGDGTFTPNTTPLTNLFTMIGSLPESQDLIDASFIKLREASISYTIEKKYFKKAPISGITIGVFGRNLKYWLPAENVFADPESNSFGQNGNVQGLEFSSVPTARSVGFDFKLRF